MVHVKVFGSTLDVSTHSLDSGAFRSDKIPRATFLLLAFCDPCLLLVWLLLMVGGL